MEEHQTSKRNLFEALDDLVVFILTDPKSLIKSYEARRHRIEPIVDAIDELITF